MEKSLLGLTAPVLVKLTKEDSDLLEILSKKADCTPGQLARYAIRIFIHSKSTDNNAEA